MCIMLEVCTQGAEEDVKHDGERKNCVKEKETIAQTDIPIVQTIADAIEDGWLQCQDVMIASKHL